MRITVIGLLALPAALFAQGIPVAPPPADSSMRQISIDQAVKLAEQNNPTAVVARGQTREAASAVRAAYGALLPNVIATMGQTQQNGDRFQPNGQLVPYIAPPWSYTTGITSSLTLFDGGKKISDIATNKANERAAVANETTQNYSLALQVKTQYAAILAAQEGQAAARIQLDMAQEQLKASIAKVAAGAATVSDSLRSIVTVGNAQLALLTAQNGVQTASAALTRLVGTPYLVTANPADSVDTPLAPIDTAALMSLALRGPTVVQAEANLASARAAERSAKTSYLPTVTLSYNRAGSGFDPYYGLGPGRLAYSNLYSLGLTFPVFNQWTRENNITIASVNQDDADALLRDSRLGAQQNLITQLSGLSTADAQIRIGLQTVAADEEDLRVQTQRYNLGASTLLDVLTSQSNLVRDQAALIQARQNFRVARAQIEAIIGRDLQ